MHLWPTMKLRNSFKLAYVKRIDKNTERMKREAAEREGLLQGQAESGQSDRVETQKNDESTSNSGIRGCCELLLLMLCCCTCFCCGACSEVEDDAK